MLKNGDIVLVELNPLSGRLSFTKDDEQLLTLETSIGKSPSVWQSIMHRKPGDAHFCAVLEEFASDVSIV